jgi:hypothetical protein
MGCVRTGRRTENPISIDDTTKATMSREAWACLDVTKQNMIVWKKNKRSIMMSSGDELVVLFY